MYQFSLVKVINIRTMNTNLQFNKKNIYSNKKWCQKMQCKIHTQQLLLEIMTIKYSEAIIFAEGSLAHCVPCHSYTLHGVVNCNQGIGHFPEGGSLLHRLLPAPQHYIIHASWTRLRSLQQDAPSFPDGILDDLLVLQILIRLALAQGEDLPHHHAKGPDVRLLRKLAVKALCCHPANWEESSALHFVVGFTVQFFCSCQSRRF